MKYKMKQNNESARINGANGLRGTRFLYVYLFDNFIFPSHTDLECHDGRDVFDESGYAEDHVSRCAVLLERAINLK